MKVSVVIPTVNRRDTVLRTVESVLRQDYQASDFEIVVVVDGSSDDTADALRRFDRDKRIRVLEQENRGLPSARNSGWRITTGELLVFLDDDMTCSAGWLSAHVAAHQEAREQEFAGLGPIYISPAHPPSLAAAMFVRGQGAEFLRQRDNPGRSWPENVWSFANTSITRGLLDRLGGFDERFRMREDGEMGVRLLKMGVHQRFVKDAVAYQSCNKRPRELVEDAEAFAQYDLLFLKEHPGWTPHDFVTDIGEESRWKSWARQTLTRHLRTTDALLAPLCAIGEWRVTPASVRELAVRAMLFRCGLHWYRRLKELRGNT